jgi:hypothetical protein
MTIAEWFAQGPRRRTLKHYSSGQHLLNLIHWGAELNGMFGVTVHSSRCGGLMEQCLQQQMRSGGGLSMPDNLDSIQFTVNYGDRCTVLLYLRGVVSSDFVLARQCVLEQRHRLSLQLAQRRRGGASGTPSRSTSYHCVQSYPRTCAAGRVCIVDPRLHEARALVLASAHVPARLRPPPRQSAAGSVVRALWQWHHPMGLVQHCGCALGGASHQEISPHYEPAHTCRLNTRHIDCTPTVTLILLPHCSALIFAHPAGS